MSIHHDHYDHYIQYQAEQLVRIIGDTVRRDIGRTILDMYPNADLYTLLNLDPELVDITEFLQGAGE